MINFAIHYLTDNMKKRDTLKLFQFDKLDGFFLHVLMEKLIYELLKLLKENGETITKILNIQ